MLVMCWVISRRMQKELAFVPGALAHTCRDNLHSPVIQNSNVGGKNCGQNHHLLRIFLGLHYGQSALGRSGKSYQGQLPKL